MMRGQPIPMFKRTDIHFWVGPGSKRRTAISASRTSSPFVRWRIPTSQRVHGDRADLLRRVWPVLEAPMNLPRKYAARLPIAPGLENESCPRLLATVERALPAGRLRYMSKEPTPLRDGFRPSCPLWTLYVAPRAYGSGLPLFVVGPVHPAAIHSGGAASCFVRVVNARPAFLCLWWCRSGGEPVPVLFVPRGLP